MTSRTPEEARKEESPAPARSAAGGPEPGVVYLVGAGPGDPGLLTRRGAELLGRADAVVHDHLAAPELLSLAPPGSKKIYVGKTGSRHTLRQDDINRLLAEEALAGRTVVRLKGGDPYVFGRGAEEALELRRRGIRFEVVPGVTSAVAAAACAGIPLTHRDLASQVVLITGREKPGKSSSSHDWAALAKMGTLAAVMGAENLPEIAGNLIAAGKDPGTPAALVQWGTTAGQRTARASLGDLPGLVKKLGLGPPALLVVGEVAGLGRELDWFEERPLFGKTVLVTRTAGQAGKLSARLAELGARVLGRPAIEIVPITPNPGLAEAVKNLRAFKHLVLTSPNGARIFMESVLAAGLDARALFGVRIAVIGPGTDAQLRPFGLKADVVPPEFIAESLLASLSREKPGPLLLARAEEARDVLPRGLADLGFEVAAVPLYRTRDAVWPDFPAAAGRTPGGGPDPGTEAGVADFLAGIDLATLTSASAARGLAAHVPENLRGLVKAVSIGPVTTREARALGLDVVAEARQATVEHLAEAAASLFPRT
ncbi:MAG: uroporphyrinogen-III C-methyltransferase [Deltaproteobacteria bacterium]|nr:uroporphyrinogen-III C-methyltransferase [Deltaproteobacteria bacterium]